GKVIETYDAMEVFKGVKNTELKDGDFVYVTESKQKQIYVFGKTMPNGLVKFTQSERFDLRTLIGKLGGMREETSRKISIISEKGIEHVVWDEYTNIELVPDSIVVFDEDTENFVYIVAPTGTAKMVRLNRTANLYEILSLANIDKNYRKFEIISKGKKYMIHLSDIAQSFSYNVYPGDILRIIDAPENYAFVFGEVNKPGIVTLTENTTVLQAIIQAGYFTAKAVPSSIWLYKGGVNGQPLKIDLSVVMGGGKPKDDPILEPGDVVYVPADMFRTALEWLPIINNLINFYSNLSGLFK
ncbi:MAG: polysaccharide biosynthesis/export family protein, partial [Fervidobacterium sp.]